MAKRHGTFKLLAGVAAGVGLGLLFAPQEGTKTRKELKVKLDELFAKAKEINIKEVQESITMKIDELKEELADLDKEKALKLAKEQYDKIAKKAEELYAYAKEKGTPVLEKTAKEAKTQTIKVAKEIINKLETPKATTKK